METISVILGIVYVSLILGFLGKVIFEKGNTIEEDEARKNKKLMREMSEERLKELLGDDM